MFGDTGFESDNPVTVYARGTSGAVISEGAKVKLMGTGIENISFNPAATILEKGNGFIEVQLDEGTVTFK